MNHRQAFNKTLQTYRITAKSLSEATGIQERQISLFRNEKSDLITENFFQLIEALPEHAREYFFSQMHSSDSRSLIQIIETATDEEIEEAMLAIARKWRGKSGQNNGHSKQALSA